MALKHREQDKNDSKDPTDDAQNNIPKLTPGIGVKKKQAGKYAQKEETYNVKA